jgi:GntR family transcriptional regulator/MocR family aminotransferase
VSPTTPIVLDRTSDEPLYRQIEGQLRGAIRDGRLRPGARLPGVRTLAGDLGVARITVATAYEQLAAEGYVDGRVGSGTRVSADPPGSRPEAPRRPPSGGATAGDMDGPARPSGTIDLRPDAARLDDFPFQSWERLLREAVQELSGAGGLVDEPGGDPLLRSVLAERLGASRGLRCDAGQILVTTGDFAALSTIADAWPGPTAPALVEEPGLPWIRELLAARGRRVVALAVDEHGLRPDALPPELGAPVGLSILVHVTPAWGAVLGGTLPPERRRELLARLGRAVRIVEDDRDGELRLQGPPPPALAGQDPFGRVIHLRSLERDLHPGARLGYLVAPASDAGRIAAFVEPQGRGPGIIEQRALARFIQTGLFDRHLRRLRRRLLERQAAMLEAFERTARGRLVTTPVAAGRHLVVRLVDPSVAVAQVAARAATEGVAVTALRHRTDESGPWRPAGGTDAGRLLVGFGGAEPADIADGVRRLVRALDRLATEARRPQPPPVASSPGPTRAVDARLPRTAVPGRWGDRTTRPAVATVLGGRLDGPRHQP